MSQTERREAHRDVQKADHAHCRELRREACGEMGRVSRKSRTVRQQTAARKLVFILAGIVILGSGFFGGNLMNVMAEEPSAPPRIAYYKSIQIEKGDTLWSIAREYAPDAGLSVPEYIDLLMEMNRLHDDTIHEGCHLTVRY